MMQHGLLQRVDQPAGGDFEPGQAVFRLEALPFHRVPCLQPFDQTAQAAVHSSHRDVILFRDALQNLFAKRQFSIG